MTIRFHQGVRSARQCMPALILAAAVVLAGCGTKESAGTLIKRADSLRGQCRYRDAIDAAEDAVSAAEDAQGSDGPMVARALAHLALPEIDLMEYRDAKEAVDRAAAIVKYLGPAADSVSAFVDDVNGAFYLDQQLFSAARTWYERARTITASPTGEDLTARSAALAALARIHRYFGALDSAEELDLKAIAVLNDDPEHVDHDLHIPLIGLAQTRRARGQLTEADSLVRIALHDAAAFHGKASFAVAVALEAHAGILRDMGQASEAVRLGRQALDMKAVLFGSDHPRLIVSLNNIALYMQDTARDPSEAEDLYLRALTIFDADPARGTIEGAEVLEHLAALYRLNGRYRAADSSLRRSIRLIKGAGGANDPHLCSANMQLAELEEKEGYDGTAEIYYRDALRSAVKAFAPNSPMIASIRKRLASLLLAHRQFQEADSLYRLALAANLATCRTNRAAIARDLTHLGDVFEQEGRLHDADTSYTHAIAIDRAYGLQTQRWLALELLTLGRIKRSEGRFAESEALLRESIALRIRIYEADDERRARGYDELAALFYQTNRADSAKAAEATAATIRARKREPAASR